MHKNPKLLALESYTKWMFATLPASFAYAPLSTFVPLYVLFLGGSAVQVAITMTVWIAVSTVSAFAWGKISDITGRRKLLIMISYIGMTLLLILMYYAHSIYAVTAIFGAIGLVQQANPTAYNLLVMETDKKENWPKNFSKLQAISNTGMVLGLVASAIIAGVATLHLIILVFALSSALSAIVALALIIEPEVSVKKETSIFKNINDMFVMVIFYPFKFVKLPSRKSIRNIGSIIKNAQTPIGLMLVSWLIFNVAMSMYNTEYAASLNIHGVSESLVFSVILVAIVLQTIFFYYAENIIDKKDLMGDVFRMTTLRGIAYLLTGITFFTYGIAFLLSNLILYTIIAGIAYPILYTVLYALLFNLIGGSGKGNILGMYNGIGWLGYLFGAMIAGALVGYGFVVLYIVSGIILFFSLYPLIFLKRGENPKASLWSEIVAVPVSIASMFKRVLRLVHRF